MTEKFNKLRLRRVALNLKQKDVAASVGITQQYLFALEHGKAKNPSIDVMKKLAAVLETTPQELFF